MFMKPVFKNVPNKCYTIEGKEIWVSRSVAVVCCVSVYYNDKTYILAEKRSSKMDMSGKWSLPCGYLDFSESGTDAAIREVYEETGIFLPEYFNDSYINCLEQPFYVSTEPNDFKQNISLIYGIDFELNELPNISEHKTDEVEELKQIEHKDINQYEWAFRHNDIIEQWLVFIDENS